MSNVEELEKEVESTEGEEELNVNVVQLTFLVAANGIIDNLGPTIGKKGIHAVARILLSLPEETTEGGKEHFKQTVREEAEKYVGESL